MRSSRFEGRRFGSPSSTGATTASLGRALAEKTGAPLDRAGRLLVEPDLTVPGRPEILVIGNLASFTHQTGGALPGVAPVAMQQGRYAAESIRARLRGSRIPPFHFDDPGNMATIGRTHAVAMIRDLRFSGHVAWLLWLFVHLLYIVEFENRLLILLRRAWNYFTGNRGAGLSHTSDRASPAVRTGTAPTHPGTDRPGRTPSRHPTFPARRALTRLSPLLML